MTYTTSRKCPRICACTYCEKHEPGGHCPTTMLNDSGDVCDYCKKRHGEG